MCVFTHLCVSPKEKEVANQSRGVKSREATKKTVSKKGQVHTILSMISDSGHEFPNMIHSKL